MPKHTDGDHINAMFRDCRRPFVDEQHLGCIGGRMFWNPAEPQFARELGWVGLCSHCGWQVFTQDLLGSDAPIASRVYNQFDLSEKSVRRMRRRERERTQARIA